jgi:hypothetical protein
MNAASEKALTSLRQSSKPILFETGMDEAPYSGAGTGFLTLFEEQFYLLTARHVVKGANLDELMVFPNNESDESIPFNASFQVSNPQLLDSDYSDFSVLRVATEKLVMAERLSMQAIRMDNLSSNWKTVPEDYEFIFFGYPTEARGVDYKRFRVASTQHLLVGRLVGVSTLEFCFELEITDFNGVSDLNGLSGSPVVAIPRKCTDHVNAVCGMLIRGTATSGRVHFIDANLIRRALEQVQTPNRRLQETRMKPRAPEPEH